MKLKPPVIIVIEIWTEYSRNSRWEPTVGMALGRTTREVLAEWREANPNDKFRASAYRRVEGGLRKKRK